MRRRSRRAFTLIEMLVVIIIIATLATGVVLTVANRPGEARVARAKADIAKLESVIEQFRLDMRRYPDEEEGLAALVSPPDSADAELWRGKYIKRNVKDPWGRPYIYRFPGEINADGFDLVSYGLDGEEGGEGENADVGNWESEEMFEE